ncbi:MAG: hypothetical protein H7Z41_07190 [Cytophagales bacterium]|nr:hypothetical protein [Armatimonadota bacterium]
MSNETDPPLSPADVPNALEIGVAAAMSRQYAEDSRAFLLGLASLLESALPGEARVRRVGLIGGSSRPIRRIEVDFTEGRFAIEDPGRGPLLATRTQIVRSVALKTETLGVDAWIEAVSGAIARRAVESKAARDALRQLL